MLVKSVSLMLFDFLVDLLFGRICNYLPSAATIESVHAISAHISLATYIVLRCYVGSCNGYNSRLSFRCNAVAEAHDIPGLDTWAMLMMPAYYQFSCRGIPWSSILTCYVLNAVAVCWAIVAAGSHFENGWIGGD